MEMTAQLERARAMGFEPTHLDTHMGTVYATRQFLMAYIQLGIKNHIPVMLPGGADKLIMQQGSLNEQQVAGIRTLGKLLWNAGLPVLDDLHNFSYDWKVPTDIAGNDEKLDRWRTDKYIDALDILQPGVTMMIMHCSDAGEHFTHISDSGPLRRGDMLAMLDPAFKKALVDQHIFAIQRLRRSFLYRFFLSHLVLSWPQRKVRSHGWSTRGRQVSIKVTNK